MYNNIVNFGDFLFSENYFQQRAYNVDHSAEIKELENKRAQIFFEALAQQHKYVIMQFVLVRCIFGSRFA